MAFGLDLCVCVNFDQPSGYTHNTQRRSRSLHSSRQVKPLVFCLWICTMCTHVRLYILVSQESWWTEPTLSS